MVRTKRTNKRIGGRIKRKWGDIGAPGSKKRKAHCRKIARMKKKKKGRRKKKG